MSKERRNPDWLETAVDGILTDETDRRSTGRPVAEWHAHAFTEIETLLDEGRSLRDAAEIVSRSPESWRSVTVDSDSLRKMYLRHLRQRLADEAGQAVLDDDEDAFITAYKKLRERDRRDGNTNRREK